MKMDPPKSQLLQSTLQINQKNNCKHVLTRYSKSYQTWSPDFSIYKKTLKTSTPMA